MRSLLAGVIGVCAAVAVAGQGVTPPTTTRVGPGQATPPKVPTVGTQPSVPGGPGALVVGHVVDNTGSSVPTVAVRLIGERTVRTVVSDTKGRFYFANIPPGEYIVTAKKFGYYDGAYGKRRAGGDPLPFPVFPGQAIPDMRIELFRAAVITGSIIDEAGEPVVGARVVAMRRMFVEGEWQYVAAGSDATDDQGFYRIYGLEPGEYLVSTPTTQFVATAESLGAIPPGLPDTEREDLAYPTLFYPATRHFLLALPVNVASGEVRPAVNFQWTPVAARSVSGRLIGAGAADQVVKLLPADSREVGLGNDAAVTLSRPDGSFTFTRVPAGEYRLEAGGGFTAAASSLLDLVPPGANAPPDVIWGRASISVSDDDVRDVAVPLRTGLTISGEIALNATDSRTSGAADVRFTRIPVSIVPAQPGLSRIATPHIYDDGRFVAANLVPGEYFVRVGTLPPGWFLKSVSGGGRNLIDDPADTSDGDVVDVRIVLTDRATEILGSVRDARMQAASGAAVIVMPAAGARFSPNRTRRTRASTNGQFVIAGLPPGDYLIVAIDDADAEGWQDAPVLSRLQTLATRLTLRDAEHRTLQLRLSPLRR